RPGVVPVEDPAPAADGTWASEHPLFRLPDGPETPGHLNAGYPEPEERFVPGPPPPLPRPAWPVLIGWGGIGFAALVVLTAAFGLPLPAWVGAAAWIGFVGGFLLLVVRLPRHRPPDAGDGAVL
ncbi:MAG: hypothetical protein ACLGIF_04040, partial [Actinomycetes bacterium]